MICTKFSCFVKQLEYKCTIFWSIHCRYGKLALCLDIRKSSALEWNQKFGGNRCAGHNIGSTWFLLGYPLKCKWQTFTELFGSGNALAEHAAHSTKLGTLLLSVAKNDSDGSVARYFTSLDKENRQKLYDYRVA